MRLQAVSAHGYINLRCKNDPGCPSTLHQMSPMPHDLQYQYVLDQLPEILQSAMGMDLEEIPSDIGHQCCAQFALSKEQIQMRSQVEYHNLMVWIGTSDTTDNYGIGWLISSKNSLKK